MKRPLEALKWGSAMPTGVRLNLAKLNVACEDNNRDKIKLLPGTLRLTKNKKMYSLLKKYAMTIQDGFKEFFMYSKMGTKIQENQFLDVQATSKLIKKGHILVLSADENLFKQLPRGKWIGGTTPYFYLKSEMGRMDKDHIMVSDFTDVVKKFKITKYDAPSLKNICKNGFENGFNFMILPALRDIHYAFALDSPNYENLFQNPLIGLIAGAELEEFSKNGLSKVINGETGESYTDSAVVLHVELFAKKVARVEIINVFEPSYEVFIEVEEDTFIVKDCIINGEKANLYDYLKENNIDISYPLVADCSGITVNVSFQRLDDEKKEVVFYAPLFKGKKYTTSIKFDSYANAFARKLKIALHRESNIIYNCNCILNYIYGELDKNDIGFSGATTFGEIAYNLLNQTFTYLVIDEY